MARNEQEPTVTQNGDKTIYKHPAYGQVTVTRVSGGSGVLYGSDFRHQHYVRVGVYPSTLERHNARDWPLHSLRPIAEFEMSEAQWAAFVSSFGNGDGTQCTLVYYNGQEQPRIPYRDEGQEYKVDMGEALQETLKDLYELKATVEANVAGLSKAKQAEILKGVNNSIRTLSQNLPFIASSFAEHMETRTEKAKVEINSYATQMLVRTGLAALGVQEAPLQIDVTPSKSE